MTRKDYEALAAAFRAARPKEDKTDMVWQWDYTAYRVADALYADNERFDRDKFYAACYR